MPQPVKPMLADLELPLVQRIHTQEEQILVDHPVPGLDGDFTQLLNRQATQVALAGILAGEDAKTQLETLRQKFHAGEPVAFVADILTATQVQQVIITGMEVRELAGKTERFEYYITLAEYTPPPADETEALALVDEEAADEAEEETDAQVEDIDSQLGVIEVEVLLASGERDFAIAEVRVEGTTEAGENFQATQAEHTDGLFRIENVPTGTYTVRAVRRE
jgi:hypothetical protein